MLVIGSLNANPADRELTRSAIRSMQWIGESQEVHPIDFFNSWGDLGMSSMAWRAVDPYTLYIASSTELFRFRLKDTTWEKLPVPNLTDIHEIRMAGDLLWISNTKHDEIVSFDTQNNRVEKRINLSDFKSNTPEEGENAEGVEVVDKFHCNLIFEGYEGDTYILVHHTSGRQLIKRIAQKFIKNQGNGGVVNISKRKRYPLNFKAPHTVRLINNQYWVFDSGHFELKIFDRNWNFLRTMNTRGFGRGADIDAEHNLYYGGISETRKRYLGLFPGGEAVPNMVQVFSIPEYKMIGSILIPYIEQINNVYCLEEPVLEMLLRYN